MSNTLLADAILAAAEDRIACCSVTEVKLGKEVPFYYNFRGTLDLFGTILFPTSHHSLTVGAFAAPASQFPNQLLGGFSYVFRQYITYGRHVGRAAFSDIC